MADITIHIDDSLDTPACEQLQNELSQRAGVNRVIFNERKRHLFVVDFDSSLTSSHELMGTVTGHGYRAELVGL